MNSFDFIIKLNNQGIQVNNIDVIPYERTNLPKAHFTFGEQSDIFWRAHGDLNQSKKTLTLSITNYEQKNTEAFSNQKSINKNVQIYFEKLDWNKWEKQLSFYSKNMLLNIIHESQTKKREIPEWGNISALQSDKYSKLSFDSIYHEPNHFQQNLNIPFNNLTFEDGFVSFNATIGVEKINMIFKIHNTHLKKEFENIKHWFSKKLRLKENISASVSITISNGEILETKATSLEIDKITPELIDTVRETRTIGLAKILPETNNQRNLYTTEDIFESLRKGQGSERNVFDQSEMDILNIIINKGKVRNKQHISYLADVLQSLDNKIRYTLKPHFGFLFLVEENNHFYFVWELLNSHATYIWTAKDMHINNSIQYERIEKAFNFIRLNGREKYKQAYKSGNIDNDLIFKSLEHSGVDLTPEISFELWKKKINNFLKNLAEDQ